MLEAAELAARVGKFRMSPKVTQNAGWVPHPSPVRKDAIEREATGAKGQHPDSCTAAMGLIRWHTGRAAEFFERQEAKRESRYVPNSGRWMVVAGLYGFTALIALRSPSRSFLAQGTKPFRGGFR